MELFYPTCINNNEWSNNITINYKKYKYIAVNIESTASDIEIDKLKDIVNAHCPVLDLFRNKTPIDIYVSRKP